MATRCKGRDARGRIKPGYRLTRAGLVKVGGRKRATTRRRKTTAKRRRKRAPAGLAALLTRARKVRARHSPGATALRSRARKVAARYRRTGATVVVLPTAGVAKPPAPSRRKRPVTRWARKRATNRRQGSLF